MYMENVSSNCIFLAFLFQNCLTYCGKLVLFVKSLWKEFFKKLYEQLVTCEYS